jgi:hypothetical protein
MRRRHWFLAWLSPRPEELELERLRIRVRIELPPGQRRVALALLVDGPEFDPPERPVTYDVIGMGLNIQITTVREHLRRVRRTHPNLFAELMAERRRRLDLWHADVARRRAERSRRWGKHRWASRYRAQHGVWPWLDHEPRGE